MDDRDIARWRLVTQHLTGPRLSDPEAVVRHLLAVQAENYGQAGWALAARCQPTTAEVIDGLVDDGVLLRLHVIRTTWHFVLPDDIRWLCDLTGPRLRTLYKQTQRGYGVDDRTLAACVDAAVESVTRRGPRTRDQLRSDLDGVGLPSAGPALTLVTATAESHALLCSGPLASAEQTYALVSDRAPTARVLDRDEALAELALRYVGGHGPATDRDLAYWATLPVTDIRRGLAGAGDRLSSFGSDGRRYWVVAGSEPPGSADGPPTAHLLQILDEIYRGYQDSRYALDAAGLLERGREPAMGMALVDGQFAGLLTRKVTPKALEFALTPHRPLTQTELSALQATADAYGAYLGLPTHLR